MESREYESGRSKCSDVMSGIGAETSFTRKHRRSGGVRRVPTSGRCFVARESGRTLKTEKQRTSRATEDGASVNPAVEWNAIDWRIAKVEVKRLQMRIAKADNGRVVKTMTALVKA